MRVLASIVAGSLALLLASTAGAQQLTYTPINPSFGGNPFNSAHLNGLASTQNQTIDKSTSASATETQAQLFADQLQSRLLSALASQVTDAIFGANPQQQGTISFGDQTISFFRTLNSVTLTITDAKGGQTVITVPTFVKIQ